MITKVYQNFDLWIEPAQQGYRARASSLITGEATTTFTIPFSADEMNAITAARFSGSENRHVKYEDDSRSYLSGIDVKNVGERLFSAVFNNTVHTSLLSSLLTTNQTNAGLRIRLRLNDVPELAILPWEYIRGPAPYDFFALSTQTPIVRYLELQQSATWLPVTPPLRLLVLISDPSDIRPRLDVEREWQRLQTVLMPLQAQKLLIVERLAARLDTLQQRLQQQAMPVHILHFIGHGTFDATRQEGGLLLETENGHGRVVSAEQLSTLLYDHQSIRLAFLNACEGAQGSTTDLFAGVAQTLVQKRLPAVIAMQYTVTDSAAIELAASFYQAIANYYPVDAALAEARKTLLVRNNHRLEWGTPVLFMRAADGQLFRTEHKSLMQMPTEIGSSVITNGGAHVTDYVSQNKPKSIEPPPEPMRLPRTDTFVGRADDLKYYTEKLTSQNMVIIEGMPGVGKTALAARLLTLGNEPDKGRIFWHTCYPNDGVYTLLSSFAAFLAWYGQPNAWELLQNSNNWNDPPRLNQLLGYLFQSLVHKNYVLWIDNIHYLISDPHYLKVIDRFYQATANGDIKLVVTSNQSLMFGTYAEPRLLKGLTLIDTGLLLKERSIELSRSLIKDLHEQTEGNAQLLTLAIENLKQPVNKAVFIAQLVEAPDVRTFLTEFLDAGLTDQQQSIMQIIATVLGWPISARAIRILLDSDIDIRSTLDYLCNRFLLYAVVGQQSMEYEQHNMLQEYYYEKLNPNQRFKLHRRAAKYYAQTELDTFKAALHYQRSGMNGLAAEFATRDLYQQLYRGRAYALKILLEKIQTDDNVTASSRLYRWYQFLLGLLLNILKAATKRKLSLGKRLDNVLQVKVKLAIGQIHAFFEENQAAQVNYEAAIAQLNTEPDSSEVRQLVAETCRELGVLLRNRAPTEALIWLKQGLEKVANLDPQREADLQIQIGIVQRKLSHFTEAQSALQRALFLLPDKPTRLRLLALLNLGTQYYQQGELTDAADYWQKALLIADQMEARINGISLRNNLGAYYHMVGRWPEALQLYQQARALAGELGNAQKQAEASLNLGVLYAQMGENEQAKALFAQSLELARQVQDSETIVLCLAHQAELMVEESQLIETVLADLQPAIHLADRAKLIHLSPFLNYVQASAWLNCAPPTPETSTQARTFAQAAVDSARQQKMLQEEGFSLRVLGQVYAASGDLAAAIASFTQSEALLTDIPYYLARTQAAWGACLIAHGKDEEGKALLQKARLIFTQLDAKRDLANLE